MPRLITLFRPVNLLLIALIQLIIQYRVIIPHVGTNDVFSELQFMLIVLITVIVGTAGYVINDIFDIQIDSHNKPGKNLVGTAISVRNGKGMYRGLVFSGLILTTALGSAYRLPGIGFYILATASLYAYSAWFKKSPLIGNLTVSLFAGMVIYVLWMGQNLVWIGSQKGTLAFEIVVMYTVFAFVTTMVREIVKDIEDIDGDKSCGARTLPIVIGIRASRFICTILAALLAFGLVYWLRHIHQSIDSLAERYFILAVLLPVTAIAIAVMRSRDKRDWYRVSQFIKVVILLGTLFLILV